MDAQDITDLLEFEDEGERAETPVLRLGRGVHDISIRDYLADPCEQPSLRSSDINTILRLTPAHVRANHPRLSDDRERVIRKATKRMDLGSVVHELLLGKGSGFCVIDKTDFKTTKGEPAKGDTKEYKEAVAAAVARGLCVLSSAGSAKAQKIADQLAKKLSDSFEAWPFGETERTLIWTEFVTLEDGTEVEVWCRSRPDVLAGHRAIVCDAKSTELALSDDGVQRAMSADDGQMFIQAAWQKRGVLALFPELADDLRHAHIFCETVPPHEPRLIHASIADLLTADLRCSRAVVKFAEMMRAGTWEGWAPATINVSPWLAAQWATQENAEVLDAD